MTTGYSNAIDEIYGLFNVAWLAGTTAIVGYIPQIYWQGNETNDLPEIDKYYVRFNIKPVLEQQKTLSNVVDGIGKKRYNNVGMLFANIFTPLSDVTHMEKGRSLAELGRNAYRGKTTAGGIFFRNATIEEFSHSDKYFNFRVVAEYDYDDIG